MIVTVKIHCLNLKCKYYKKFIDKDNLNSSKERTLRVSVLTLLNYLNMSDEKKLSIRR